MKNQTSVIENYKPTIIELEDLTIFKGHSVKLKRNVIPSDEGVYFCVSDKTFVKITNEHLEWVSKEVTPKEYALSPFRENVEVYSEGYPRSDRHPKYGVMPYFMYDEDSGKFYFLEREVVEVSHII